ncbi:universal stress protein [Nonomuraea sp. NBC_01738]|uniref:universal stress protein n=1 Tax=Nonomuraea sp. NBC_01738 TaxID=2976003 RepID=UPI002E15B4C3|nr:universal stress protein [Nonomuraea sp. NBC_01738]
MNTPVLVATDGSAVATEAVRWAAVEAARSRRALRVVHVSGVWAYDRPTRTALGALRELGEREREILAQAVRAARAVVPGLPVETAMIWGKVTPGLHREAECASLLVLGRHGHGHGLTAALRLGSAVTGLAANAPCPVVVVPGLDGGPYGEVVAGYEGDSSAVLEYAFDQAVRRGATLRAIHAWMPPYPGFTLHQQVFDNAEAEAERVLRPWRERYPQVTVIGQTVCGGAVPALNAASARADLVVVGARKAILGSVTNGVLHGARCPVVVVQPAHALAGSR